jgi:uncharacterized protein YkwD
MKRLVLLALASFSLTTGAQNRIEKELIKEINRFRVANGLDTATYSAGLSKASRHHARWMSITGLMSHDETCQAGTLKTLLDLEDRFREYRFFENAMHGNNENITFIGRNAEPAAVAKEVVTAWSNSPGHRANMLESSSKRVEILIGVSVYCEPGKNAETNTAVVMNLGSQIKLMSRP